MSRSLVLRNGRELSQRLSNSSKQLPHINCSTRIFGWRPMVLQTSLIRQVSVSIRIKCFRSHYQTLKDVSETIIPAPLTPNGDSRNGVRISPSERRRIFKQIIVKCVLQLLLIETTNELLQNKDVYSTIPPEHLLRLMGVLDHSYQFARMFNEDKELRTALWKVGTYAAIIRVN